MKNTSILFAFLFLLSSVGYTQDAVLTQEYKEKAIHTLSQLMNDFYVFPEVSKKTETHLLAQLKEGHFNAFDNKESFAEALTTSVQSINKDKHMRIRANRPYVAPEHTPERMIEEQFDFKNRSRNFNSGLNTVKIMEGNVGYLDLRGFAGLQSGKPIADAYMKLLARTDAVIIDLSKNGGGSPDMVQYLCSFFFDKKLHLNSLYYREGDQTKEYWTLNKIGGVKMPDVPLFVITSSTTFSGAEEFSYNMQTQKRATLVGQTSGGGANPGGTRIINEDLSVFIPTGRAINPITKTNWEGTGVIPDVVTPIDSTLKETHQMAMEAAEAFRTKQKDAYTKTFKELTAVFDNYTDTKSDAIILKALTDGTMSNIISEQDINALGYEYLMRHQKPLVAEAIFKSNTLLYPNSANVYDSYGEVLMMKGDLKASLKNYQKAVNIADQNEDRDVEFYLQNMQVVIDKMKEKK